MTNTKPKFNIEDYPRDYAMHVTTVEQAKIFCDYLDSLGRSWHSGGSYKLNTFYYRFAEDTCYVFNSNLYSSVEFCKGLNYTILEFDDFNWEE